MYNVIKRVPKTDSSGTSELISLNGIYDALTLILGLQ